jgi:hypothetical protein
MLLKLKYFLIPSLVTFGLLANASVGMGSEQTQVNSDSSSKEPGMDLLAPFISNGSVISFDNNNASIVPIPGWQVMPKGHGMSLVMKEMRPESKGAIDYSKPSFSRNITVMTLNAASPIDTNRAETFATEYSELAQKSGMMSDFAITSQKFFNYKSENDGIVYFAQHIANNFPMQQMIILVSSESKQYVLTYTDLAANFANQDSYDAAWKAMTSILVSGVAPKRYHYEGKIALGVLGFLVALMAPFMIARIRKNRRLRKAADELQSDWDNGEYSPHTAYSNVSHLGSTRVAKNISSVSQVSNISSSPYSKARTFSSTFGTKKRHFSTNVSAISGHA